MKDITELQFRIVFGILWVVYFIIRIYFQRKVTGMGAYELVNQKQEKILFQLHALAYLLWVFYIFTPWLDFARLPFPAWLRWAGAALTIGGIGLLAWSHQVLGKNWTAVLALSPKHQLVTDGPYRRIRHPMYTAFTVITLGFLALSANWLLSLLYFGTLAVMVAARLPAEEKMMLSRFGDEYLVYMNKSGRLLPKI